MKRMLKKIDNYMVLLVDRKRARMFSIRDGVVEHDEEVLNGYVPQKVKHGDDTWDAQDKIFRHIEDHLHRHLVFIAQHAATYAKKNHSTAVIVGSHKPLFPKIKKHLSAPLSKKVKGTFVTELKVPFGEILKRTKKCIEDIERDDEIKKYETYFTQDR